jgi:hypothetical protein
MRYILFILVSATLLANPTVNDYWEGGDGFIRNEQGEIVGSYNGNDTHVVIDAYNNNEYDGVYTKVGDGLWEAPNGEYLIQNPEDGGWDIIEDPGCIPGDPIIDPNPPQDPGEVTPPVGVIPDPGSGYPIIPGDQPCPGGDCGPTLPVEQPPKPTPTLPIDEIEEGFENIDNRLDYQNDQINSLKGDIARTNDRINSVGAMSAAMIHSVVSIPVRDKGDFGIGAGVGNMGNSTAVSISGAGMITDNIKVSGSAAMDEDGAESMVGAGIGIKF